MKKIGKIVLLIAVIVMGLFLCALGTLFIYRVRGNTETTPKLAVYYYNPNTGGLEAEERSLPEGDADAQLAGALALMKESPRNTVLVNKMPSADLLIAYALDGNVLEAVFAPDYRLLTPIDETLLRMSFVWTLTELPFVSQVRMMVNGEDLVNARGVPLGLLNRDNVDINPVISPERVTARPITLYFINTDANALLPVERATASVNVDQQEKYIIQQLIDGPVEENCIPSIPADTKIREVKTEDGICYVNLSGDFSTKFTGNTALARLTVYSIVNSLIENVSNVKRVQFLIDSELWDQFQGVTDFNRPFEKNETLVVGYTPGTE